MSILNGLLGSFGTIIFTVSDSYIKTFQDLSVSQKSKYADHEVAGQKPISEKTGDELDEIRFKMQLLSAYSPSPLIDLAVLNRLKENGIAQRLIVGVTNFGKFTLREINHEWIHISNRGAPKVLEIELMLVEYIDTISNQAMTAERTDSAMKDITGKGGPDRLPGSYEQLKNRNLIPFE